MTSVYANWMDHCSSFDTLRTELENTIENMEYQSGNDELEKVYNFSGTSLEALLQEIPHLVTPCVVIWYRGSVWGTRPRRMPQISLIVCVRRKGVNWVETEATLAKYVEDLVHVLMWNDSFTAGPCHVLRDDTMASPSPEIAVDEIKLEFHDQ
jgi:hypothetical protein